MNETYEKCGCLYKSILCEIDGRKLIGTERRRVKLDSASSIPATTLVQDNRDLGSTRHASQI